MNTTNRLALDAKAKAQSMGWSVRIQLDQCDVLDYATVVAWEPGSSVIRFICFIEGREARKGWGHIDQVEALLDYSNALC